MEENYDLKRLMRNQFVDNKQSKGKPPVAAKRTPGLDTQKKTKAAAKKQRPELNDLDPFRDLRNLDDDDSLDGSIVERKEKRSNAQDSRQQAK